MPSGIRHFCNIGFFGDTQAGVFCTSTRHQQIKREANPASLMTPPADSFNPQHWANYTSLILISARETPLRVDALPPRLGGGREGLFDSLALLLLILFDDPSISPTTATVPLLIPALPLCPHWDNVPALTPPRTTPEPVTPRREAVWRRRRRSNHRAPQENKRAEDRIDSVCAVH